MSQHNRPGLPTALVLILLALGVAGCATGGPQPPSVQQAAPVPLLPPAFPPQDIVGRWGLAAYHKDEDRPRIEVAAANQCKQPYIITLGPTGGVMMHLADQATPTELRLKGAPGGKTYIGPEGDPPGSAQDGHDDAEGDQGEDDGDRGADAERGAAVTQLAQRQQATEQPEGGPIRQGRDHDGLGNKIRNENRHGDDDQEPDPARPGRRTGADRSPVIRVASSSGPVQRRSSRCLQATHRVARGNACRRAFPIGSPQDSQTP